MDINIIYIILIIILIIILAYLLIMSLNYDEFYNNLSGKKSPNDKTSNDKTETKTGGNNYKYKPNHKYNNNKPNHNYKQPQQTPQYQFPQIKTKYFKQRKQPDYEQEYKTMNAAELKESEIKVDFSEFIDERSRVLPYREKSPINRRAIDHIGQRKLLLTEIEFYTLTWDLLGAEKNSVYVGAASGVHNIITMEMFPEIKLYLFDRNPFEKLLYNYPNIHIFEEYFTDEIANKFAKQFARDPKDPSLGTNMVFLSDIRTDENKDNFEQWEKEIITNMRMQENWVRILNPRGFMLKMRLPYNDPKKHNSPDSKYQYLDGDIYIQPWAPQTSTETRLINYVNTNKNQNLGELTKEYSAFNYESALYRHNLLSRVQDYSEKLGKIPNLAIPRYDYDNIREVQILYRWVRKFRPNLPVSPDIAPKYNTIMGPISAEIVAEINTWISRTNHILRKPIYEDGGAENTEDTNPLNPPMVVNHIELHKNLSFNVLDDGELIGGTKQRLIGEIINEITERELVYAGPETGMAQVALAYCVYKYNIEHPDTPKIATIFVQGTEKQKTILSQIAEKYGGKIYYAENYRTLKDTQTAATKYVENKNSANDSVLLLPFGLNDLEYIGEKSTDFVSLEQNYDKEKSIKFKYNLSGAFERALRSALANIRPPHRMWVTSGSGFILKTLQRIYPECEFMVIQVGKKIWPDQLRKQDKLFISPYKFTDTPPADELPPYLTIPWYDGKLWQFFVRYGKVGDYIWNTAKIHDDVLHRNDILNQTEVSVNKSGAASTSELSIRGRELSMNGYELSMNGRESNILKRIFNINKFRSNNNLFTHINQIINNLTTDIFNNARQNYIKNMKEFLKITSNDNFNKDKNSVWGHNQDINKYKSKYADLLKYIHAGNHVLDFGTGSGALIAKYAAENNINLTAVDIADNRADEVKRMNTSFMIIDPAANIKLPDSSFDAIICFQILHHIAPEQLDRVLADFARLLKPSGYLLIRDHNINSKYSHDVVLQEHLYYDVLDLTYLAPITDPKFDSLITNYEKTHPITAVSRTDLRDKLQKLHFEEIYFDDLFTSSNIYHGVYQIKK